VCSPTARVRVWSPSGDLLFTTDAGDESDAVSGDLDAVYAATRGSGRIGSIRTDDGQVFATFVPLRLGGDRSLGAVEVDQGYERIAASSASPWSLLRTIAAAAAIVFLLLVVVASLPGAGGRTRGLHNPGSRGRARETARQGRRGPHPGRGTRQGRRAASEGHRTANP
jgi:hypothetical protein